MRYDLEINMDRKCKRCGKPGVAHTKTMEGDGKYCLTCSTKIMEERMSTKKSPKVESPKNVKSYEETRHLRYNFTQEELSGLSRELAENVRAKCIKEDEKKSITSQYGAEIDGLQAKITNAAEKVGSGYEMRMVKCAVLLDYDADVKVVTRLDTGEVVTSDKIPDGERQMGLEPGV
jgi:DNA-directed RNA polymerase subunit RPC12/RpoP